MRTPLNKLAVRMRRIAADRIERPMAALEPRRLYTARGIEQLTGTAATIRADRSRGPGPSPTTPKAGPTDGDLHRDEGPRGPPQLPPVIHISRGLLNPPRNREDWGRGEEEANES
ncbi:hypothetical protein GCM10014715_74780 [Streptomyces spiralis]|uniref:Uncharacterized protein n=1 Tax=Streptomyces spiralis TaxID=66376 RepID=A0A919AI18_9ACTN|nr:hypothetical protein GCM10014715_74780 [Streptomyces spiralis]